MAYLYNYVGKPKKTIEKVKYILDNFYTNTPDGLIGNEDCGQMSAWYVLSAMGIYSVTPGLAEWIETKPYFDTIKINFEDGNSKILTIISNKTRLGITDTNYNFVKEKREESIIPVPVIQAESKSFKDKLKIEIIAHNSDDEILYTFHHATLGKPVWMKYTNPLEISNSEKIQAYVKSGEKYSSGVSAQFFKKSNNYFIKYKSQYDPQYHAGGDEGLFDGIYGITNWRKGEWQGFQGQNFEAIVDLQEEKSIQNFSSNYLQDSRSWILMPTKVDYYISSDNVNFTFVGSVQNDLNPNVTENTIKNFEFELKNAIKGRYIKVKATNFGTLPEWHQGFGGEAYIFLDEIEVNY
jgi:uncharacterized beta-barrel protein YwiB (DUF1934 family)